MPRLDADGQPAGATRDEETAAIAHDLIGPISIISLEMELIHETLADPDRSVQEKAIRRINRNLAHLHRMVMDLRDRAALQANKLEVKQDSVDLGELARDVVDRIVATSDGRSVTVEAEAGVRVRGDGLRLERVLGNLLHNALKYTPRDSRIEVVVSAANVANLSVTDHGRGMSEDDAHHVFEKYRRGASSAGHDGVGLGLHVSRSIIEAHGGQIDVESELGRGTTFCVHLPLERSERAGIDLAG